MENDLNFYKDISKNNLPLTELLKNDSLFYNVPENWYIVITDIENSTDAVSKGLHNDVNLSATGSIITVLNTLKTVDKTIKIPYFFGGDGSTFLVPTAVLKPVLLALNNYSQHIKKTLELNLRVGQLEVGKVYKDNVTLKITKIRHNKYLTTPVVLGNGLKYAERTIKDSFKPNLISAKQNIKLNLEGMECRWDEIYPNQIDKKVICLLVDCAMEKQQAQVYGAIMKEIDLIFGDLEKRNPISTIKLKLNTSLAKIRKEMYTKIGKYQLTYLASSWLVTKIGAFYFKFFKAGRLYKYRVVQLSDTIMLDGFLNTVISGTDQQIASLKSFLDDLEFNKTIIYGMHVTHASIMSCYIEDREEKHIHFVDGTEGGYTSAAIMFKEKLKKSQFRQP
ncbi:DUF3095 domain-containing protein [Psychroserpens burtonensis]|uniref:DUF3095 domain-containing protein n=1 Tax=Psychroserpens burtonensis TaxID=49278 RepID=A0A5C7BIY4_9FLAO|nr:DUF3095 domain-containing protein [Psychroserpens burtonensis]TXE19931.1 DUF3095 domain-containing protein [Psychroserpens burtonensis]